MPELLRYDPAFAVKCLSTVLEEGDQQEIASVLRHLKRVFDNQSELNAQFAQFVNLVPALPRQGNTADTPADAGRVAVTPQVDRVVNGGGGEGVAVDEKNVSMNASAQAAAIIVSLRPALCASRLIPNPSGASACVDLFGVALPSSHA